MNKQEYPIPENESDRLRALYEYGILDTQAEEEFDAITKLASFICGTPIALISLVDKDRQWFKSKLGLDADQTERSISFCQYAIMEDKILEVKDAQLNPTFKENPLVTSDPNISFYAGAPLKDPNGNNIGTLCVIDDQPNSLSKDQKEALKILADQVILRLEMRKQSKMLQSDNQKLIQYNTHFNNSSEVMCILNKEDLSIAEVNESIQDITGYKTSELKGRSLIELIHPDDNAICSQAFHQEQTEDIFCESRLIKKNGSSINISWQATVHEDYIYASGRDISLKIKLAKQKEEYENFFNLSLDLVCIAGMDGYFKKLNPKFEQQLGFSTEELLSQPFIEFFHVDDRDDIMHQISELGKGSQVVEFDTRFITKDNTLKWLSWTASYNEHTEQIYAIARDITHRRELESDLRTAKDIAENSARVQKEFLANMSHEIRTPLNGIIGFTDLVLETELSEIQLDHLQHIKNSGESLLIIINDILDHSKMEAGEISFEKIDFNIKDRIQTVINTLSLKSQERNNKISLLIDSEVPPYVQGDPFRLNQILMNLISNAVKFTEDGAIDVFVKLINQSDSGVISLGFEIQDNGIGMSEEFQKDLFSPFKQASSDTTRMYGGTGLGMTIVKRLIELQEGAIEVQSKEGSGTTFKVQLPFNTTQFSETITSEQNGKNSMDLSGMRVLVAEDNPINQALIAGRLHSWGCNLELVENGEKALEMAKANNYDLILMDIQMPVMDGFKATEKIRSDDTAASQNVPIIALTAYSLPESIERAYATGMDGHILKPFNPNELYELLNKYNLNNTNQPNTLENSGQDVTHLNKSDQNYIDLEVLNTHAMGDQEFMKQLIGLFIENFTLFIKDCTAAAENGNQDEIAQQVHKMKPSVIMIGAKELTQMLTKLDEEASDPKKNKDLITIVSEIKTQFKLVQTALDNTLKQITNE